MKDIKRLLYVLVCAVFFVGLYLLSDFYAEEAVGKYASEIGVGSGRVSYTGTLTMSEVSLEKQINDYVRTVARQEIHLSFVGDITFEEDQLSRYYDGATGTFDFTNSFKYITRYLTSASFVSGNLDAVIAGPDNNYDDPYDKYGTAGFLYNVPESAAYNLKAAGISLLQTASGHSGDFGFWGVMSTIDQLNAAQILTTGTKKDANDKNYTIVTVNNLKVGYVAYTNEVNVELPPENAYAINTLNGYNETKIQQMRDDIFAAKRDGADLIVAMVNTGDTQATEPDESQRALFDSLFLAGADIVVGTRPYSLMPLEIRNLTNSDGTPKKGIAIYSLGTFFGSEVYDGGVNNDIGLILDVVIEKEGNHKPVISGIRLTPTCIVYTDSDIFVLPAAEVRSMPSIFSAVTNDIVNERINAACDAVLPGILEGSGLKGEYSGGTLIVNF